MKYRIALADESSVQEDNHTKTTYAVTGANNSSKLVIPLFSLSSSEYTPPQPQVLPLLPLMAKNGTNVALVGGAACGQNLN